MSNRKAATDFAVSRLDELFPGTGNGEMLRRDLDRLSDKEFEALMKRYEKCEEYIGAVVPNLYDNKYIPKEHLVNTMKKWGIEPMQRMYITDDTGKEYLSPIRRMTLLLPTARLSQTQESKISLPKDNYHIDESTGQVTGDSKGARISFNEMNIMSGKKMTGAIIEGMKVRGGDDGARRQFEHDVILNGIGNLQDAIAAGTKVKSTQVISAKLRSIHINTTADK